RELDLSYSKLGDPERWVVLLCIIKKYKIFRLNNCYLTSASCEALSSFLSRNPSLIELNLDNNTIKDAGMRLICNVSKNQIQKMSSNNCYLTSTSCRDLSSFLSRNQSLTELNLSDNPIQDSGMSLICNCMMQPHWQNNKIHLNSCRFTSGCCEVLSSFMRRNWSLTDLNLSFNWIQDSGMSLICKADNDQIQILRLKSCSLTSGCCEALCSFLKQNQSLRELDLSSNEIEDSGLSEICKADNNQLQKLSSSNCYLTSICCEALSSFLSRNQSLTELNLSNNPIKDAGMSLICNVSNNQIQKLSLNSCRFTSGCCEVLSSFMRRNRSLTDLNLSFNQIQDSGMSLICKADNDQIQNLSSNNCYLTSICCEALSSFLSRNQSLTELNLSTNPIRDAGM
uniref:Uncharacterized protein n=1 Tax=Latimeria chalumnae TaxID=7897 RepID=H3ADL4_LATCH